MAGLQGQSAACRAAFARQRRQRHKRIKEAFKAAATVGAVVPQPFADSLAMNIPALWGPYGGQSLDSLETSPADAADWQSINGPGHPWPGSDYAPGGRRITVDTILERSHRYTRWDQYDLIEEFN